jgi:hypothetical protein
MILGGFLASIKVTEALGVVEESLVAVVADIAPLARAEGAAKQGGFAVEEAHSRLQAWGSCSVRSLHNYSYCFFLSFEPTNFIQ